MDLAPMNFSVRLDMDYLVDPSFCYSLDDLMVTPTQQRTNPRKVVQSLPNSSTFDFNIMNKADLKGQPVAFNHVADNSNHGNVPGNNFVPYNCQDHSVNSTNNKSITNYNSIDMSHKIYGVIDHDMKKVYDDYQKIKSDDRDPNTSNSAGVHPLSCKPCAFYWGKGCINADQCSFCHGMHPPRKKKPMRMQKNLLILARPGGKLRFLRCSFEQAKAATGMP